MAKLATSSILGLSLNELMSTAAQREVEVIKLISFAANWIKREGAGVLSWRDLTD